MTTTAEMTAATTDPAHEPSRQGSGVSARLRIILWLLAVMAIALTLVSTVTRSILTTQAEGRISALLSQEAQEFANFVQHGRDPDTGARFGEARRLLQVHLQRQYTDSNEEILGLVGGAPDPDVLRQARDIPNRLPLHRDRASLTSILGSPESSGVLQRPQGELRWAKVPIDPGADGRAGTFVIAFHADRELAGPDQVFRLLLVISAVALLLMTGIGWVVAGRILAPVRLVRQTAAELTEQDLTRRIPVRGNDDIAALAATFNAMLDRLERAFATQRQFVDDAGHELRTPITIVAGHLEVMGDDPEERERTVRLVTDELERMSRIVEDLLLLAKAERPDFIAPRPVQLAELTADVFMKVRALGERSWELAEVAEGSVRLDEQRITQAMVQLAQNAVRHTPPGGVIKIGSRLLPDGVELYVADRGSGVRTRDREAIFERFWRGGTPRGAHGSGAGLGLSIVKAIADGHHGTVELRDTPGGGATFVLSLPGGTPPEEDLEEDEKT